jgi:rhodanese-related sulfurtransferase
MPGYPRTKAARLAAAALLLLSLEACRSFRERERPAYRRVSPAVAYSMTLDTPDVLILDLRPPKEFQGETGHLRNARNVPLARLPYQMRELGAYRGETLLVYCREGDTCGEEGMRILVASGFGDALLIDGGIDRWIRDGFKTVLTVEEVPPDGAE